MVVNTQPKTAFTFDDFEDLFEEPETNETIEEFSGSFEDASKMDEESKEKFKSSKQYNEYKAEFADADGGEANMNGKTVEEVLGLAKKDERLSHNSIEHYDIDDEIYELNVYESNLMQETIEKGTKLLETFKYLHEDLFLSLYKYRASVLPIDKIHRSVTLNRIILEKLINTPEYIKLRMNCRMDEFNAALGTEILGREALKILEDMTQKIDEFKKQKEALEDMLREEEKMDMLLDENDMLQEQMDMLQQAGQDTTDIQNQMDQNALSIEQAKAMADQLSQQADALIEPNDTLVSDTVAAMQTAAQTTSMEVAEATDTINAWGLGGGGNSRIPFASKKAAINKIRNSDKLRKFTDIIGKMKETAVTEQKKKAKHGAVEINSVTTGSKIEDTLPSERMNMVNETTKKDFMRKMTDGSLLTYAKEADKEMHKGPIIACVDTSGSMSGDRETWSKAMAISLLEIAQLQKRDFACILYSGHAREPIIISKDEISPDKIIKVAEEFEGGGTDFESPLTKASELIKQSQFKKADIVFITDGDCSISHEYCNKFNKLKEEKDFRCLGVQVDMGRGSYGRDSLKDFCDTVTTVSKIADITKADSDFNKEIFNAV